MLTTGIIRIGAIGDLINLTPALKYYKESNANERLELLCGLSCKDVLARNPDIDHIMTIDDHIIYNGSVLQKIFETIKTVIKIRHWDKCFIVHEDTRWELVANMAGIKDVLSMHDIKNINNRPAKSNYLLNKTVELSARTAFYPDTAKEYNLPESYICIAPAGARNSKNDNPQRRWKNFPELMETLKDRNVVILGKPEDSIDIKGVINLCGKTTLSDAYHIIKGADLFIGNDSGLLHLAGTTDTESIGIFTATSPEEILPTNSRIIPIWSQHPCSPCEIHGNFRTDCDMQCTKEPNIDILVRK